MTQATTSRTAAATAKRMRRSEEKQAERLMERGWVCIPPTDDGTMPTPKYATSFLHYKDYCASCERMSRAPRIDLLCVPYRRTGNQFHYRCPLGHTWTCYRGSTDNTGYFSDCHCDHCFGSRVQEEAEHWTGVNIYNFRR